jgi:peptidoglycan hydrolase-like protein with peptidoglycan-binding domain
LFTLTIAAGETWAEDRARPAARPEIAQQENKAEPATTASMQKIQRLLKLLAVRYPDRFGSVDPGRLDGVYGAETKLALRKFRAIAGLTKDSRPDTHLTADILSELALMSANETSDLSRRLEPDCSQTPGAAGCGDGKLGGSAGTAPVTGSVRPKVVIEGEIVLAQPGDQQIALRQAPRTSTPQKPAERAAVAPPAPIAGVAGPADVKLYFAQVASLRSMESAQQEWAKIKEANRTALQEEPVYFERADLNDRGIYYRILVGPLASRDAAKSLCSALSQNHRACVLAARSAADIRSTAEHAQKAGDGHPVATEADSRPKERPAPDDHATPHPATAAAIATLVPSDVRDGPGGERAAPRPEAAPETPPASTENSQLGTTDKANGLPSGSASEATATETAIAPAPTLNSNAAGENAPAAVAALPLPAIPVQRPAPQAPTAERPATSPPDAQAADAAADGFMVSTGRRIKGALLRNAHIIAVLFVLMALGALLYRRHRHKRRAASANIRVEGLPLPEMSEGFSESRQTIVTLEDDFESKQLRESRQARDEFLSRVLDEGVDLPQGYQSGDSAIRVNRSLKELLASNPAKYKSIFLSLMFLAKLGGALNRKDIVPDQLNEAFSRELGLLQSYFKIHLLELDDRHRIRKQLPGLFYCLQVSAPQARPQKVHISVA